MRRAPLPRVAAGVLAALGLACHPVPDAPHLPPSSRMMTAADLQALPVQAPDHRLAYGDDPNQFGELRLPASPGPHPVVVLVHGGCWKAAYATLRDLGPMGDALRAEGIASWNIEYRRLPQPGSGWPGTYLDVGRAVDYLRVIAASHALDLGRVVVLGHSAGGHLAMWAASRPRIPTHGGTFVADPLPVRGVLNLAGTIDMANNIPRMAAACADPVIHSLLGGPPEAVPERYAEVSASTRLPLGVRQVMVWGALETFVPRTLVEQYVSDARRAGDDVSLLIPPGAGHFEIASPRATTWPRVRAAIRSLLDGR